VPRVDHDEPTRRKRAATMDRRSVRAVFRIPLPHNGVGEITAGPLHGSGLSVPPSAAVVLDVDAGYWCRRSELELIARSLADVALISVTGTDLRSGGTCDDGVVTGLAGIAAEIARLCAEPYLFV
jgi:hypothetical protein